MITHIIKNILYRLRHGTLFLSFQYRLKKIGIYIAPYYVVQENLDYGTNPKFYDTFENYSFDFFGPEEMKAIALSNTTGYTEDQMLAWLNEGKKCLGAKYQEEIAAFMWIYFDGGNLYEMKLKLKDNEAYLTNMFTMKEFRGKGIAPYLRYKSYKILKDMGRDKIYSCTEYFNSPAINFKKKLNAKLLHIGLYIELFNKYHWNWIIKRYSGDNISSLNIDNA
jgi:predicted GNAT family acetyltransferase